jgi:hypothetical protein
MDDLKKAQQYALLAEVGRAITNFSQIESALADVFCALAGLDKFRSEVIMASIVSFEARIQVCNNLVSLHPLEGGLAPIWPKLFKKLSKALAKRNQLAHSTPVFVNDGVALAPYLSAGNLWLGRPSANLTVEEIVQRGNSFIELMAALHWLANTIDHQRNHRTDFRLPIPSLIQEIQNSFETRGS